MHTLQIFFLIFAVKGSNSNTLEEMQKRLEYIELVIQKQQSIIEHQNQTIRDLETDVQRLKSRNVQKRQTPINIAFSASISVDEMAGLGVHQAIQFDKVITDTTGSYNSADGIFNVPATGMYVFTWTISVTNIFDQETELVVNGTPYGHSYVDSESSHDRGSGSQTIVIKVWKGQHVWIRTGRIGAWHLDGHNYATFSGWLLFSSE